MKIAKKHYKELRELSTVRISTRIEFRLESFFEHNDSSLLLNFKRE